MFKTITLMSLVLLANSANAIQFTDCINIKPDKKRLECFDKVAAAATAINTTPTTQTTAAATLKSDKKKTLTESEKIISAKILHKEYKTQKYKSGIYFDIELTAVSLEKPARAIKGIMLFQDLFGETQHKLLWTLNSPPAPNESTYEYATGFDFNEFKSEHIWMKDTDKNDMKAIYKVQSIIYEDGTQKDF
ncbi:hypothetical protein [Deefgea rivuli]|uniref:hypothetical protein n=1 Tax=Deefgea rivuli TaxID=400948 RepID=UPI0004862AB6|nr:hypothetical protein [Deefgea rivuli]